MWVSWLLTGCFLFNEQLEHQSISSVCVCVCWEDIFEIKTQQDKGWGLHSGVLHWQLTLTLDPKGDTVTDRRFIALDAMTNMCDCLVLESLPYWQKQDSRSPFQLYIFSIIWLLGSRAWIMSAWSLQNTQRWPLLLHHWSPLGMHLLLDHHPNPAALQVNF